MERQLIPNPDPATGDPPIGDPAAGRGRLRRADATDVAAVLRLREVMFAGMRGPSEEPVWSAATADWFRSGLGGDPAAFAAFVVDEPDRGVVSVAVGRTVPWMPSPRNPAGLRGHVFNVATDENRRRLGYARRCMAALLGWFSADTLVDRVDLHASAEGLSLYRSLGFELPREQALQLAIRR